MTLINRCVNIRLMIVIYREQKSTLANTFGTTEYHLPYLDKTIGEVSASLWSHLGAKEFWYPASWNVKGQTYTSIDDIRLPQNQIIVWTGINLLPHEVDSNYIEQNKEECFSFDDSYILITFGASSFVNLVKKPRVSDKGVIHYELVSRENFLSSMLEALPGYEKTDTNGSVVISGHPYINSENIINSKIYGPCYISEDSTVIDSVVYPGSIIISSSLNKVSVEEGYIYASNVQNSKIESTLVVSSVIRDMVLLDSTVPAHSALGSK